VTTGQLGKGRKANIGKLHQTATRTAIAVKKPEKDKTSLPGQLADSKDKRAQE
jgi:hypothetical protein